MKHLFTLIAILCALVGAATAQINKERADSIVLKHLEKETRAYTLFAQNGVETHFTITTDNGEILELKHCWLYYVNYTADITGVYIAVNKKNGNVLEVRPTSNAVPEDIANWREVKNEDVYYTVTFAGEGISIASQTIEHGNLATCPTDPERTNYDFGGWFTDNGTFANEWNFETDAVTQDTMLYAKWEEIPPVMYTVFFAGVGISIASQTIEHGNLATRPTNPERANYNFGDWYTDNGTFANEWNFEIDVVIHDTTLYAKWEAIPPALYTVTFAGVGISTTSQTIEHGNLATRPTNPERANYDFKGWFTDNGTFANEWNFDTDIVTHDTTLYAKWEEIPPVMYTVLFVGRGISTALQTVEHGNLATRPADPEREGYDFKGWFTDLDTFANEWNFDTDAVTQDTTLYAKWEDNTLQHMIDALIGEWSWIEGTDHDGCDDRVRFKSIIKILSQNEDNSINYEIFVEDTLFSRGSFYFPFAVDIILPHGGQNGTGPCRDFWTIFYNPAMSEWGAQEKLIFSDGCFEGCSYTYERIKKEE